MKQSQIAAALLAMILSVNLFLPIKVVSPEYDKKSHDRRVFIRTFTVTENTVKNQIQKTMQYYKVDVNLAMAIAECESGFTASAKNPTSSATGIFQFTRATFMEGALRRNLSWTFEDALDYKKNINMAAYYLKKGQVWRWEASRHCWQKKL